MRKQLLISFILFFFNSALFANLDISSSKYNDACNSGTGSIHLFASGGLAPYTYIWSPTGQTTSDIRNLYAGTYTCTVTDATGATLTETVVINNDNFLDV